MAVGASRIYRGLVDHPAFNRYSVKEATSTEWLKEPTNKPIAPSHPCRPAEGTYSPGGAVFVMNGQSFMMIGSEAAKFGDGDIA
jgi:hypothetical protein